MKTGNPVSRNRLSIRKSDRVLDVGSGDNPLWAAQTLIDKYPDNNAHRAGDLVVYDHQELVISDAENLPFEDNSFDYVYCSHVLEHVENPDNLLRELMRVAKRGYIETPSLIGEVLIPKDVHKWLILELDGKLCIVSKEKAGYTQSHEFGDVFQNWLQQRSWGFKILQRTHREIFTVNYEWDKQIDFVVNPGDEEIMKYFRSPWDDEMIQSMIRPRSLFMETVSTIKAIVEITFSVIKSRLRGRDRT